MYKQLIIYRFLKISAISSLVSICWISMSPFATKIRKLWYLIAMGLVRGRICRATASAIAPWLSLWNMTSSSKILHSTAGVFPWRLSTNLIYFILMTKYKTSLVASKRAIYSTSIVLSSISVCIQISHIIGQLVHVTTTSVIYTTAPVSLLSSWFHLPEKSAST